MNPKRLVLLLALIGGCASPGVLVSEHGPDEAARVMPVETAGTYGLFMAGWADPLLRYPLAVGDPIGFDRPATTRPANDIPVARLFAVAGPDRTPLDARQSYEWRRLPAAGR